MEKREEPRRYRWVALGAAMMVSGVFLIDLCDLIFSCGCRPLWSGAAAACNIHEAAPPHCPWCAHPGWGGAVAFFSVSAAQAVAVFWPATFGLAPRLLLALVAAPIVGVVVGMLQGALFGYWS